MSQGRTDSIFRPAFVLMSGRAIGFAVAFLIPIVLARVLTKSEFGTYKQLFLIYTTLFGVAQIGLAESLYYFMPSVPGSAGRFVMNALLGLATVGGLCLALLWAIHSDVGVWLNNPALGRYLPLIGVYLQFMLVSALLEIVMTARKRHARASSAYAVSDVLRAALYVLPVVATGQFTWLLYGAVAFAVLRFSVTLWYLSWEFKREFRPGASLLKGQLSYALPFSAAVLIETVHMNLHQYVVSSNVDAATFAVYAVGCLQIPLVDFMMTSTSSVMMVRMRESLRDDDASAVLDMWRNSTRRLALLFIPLVGGLIVVAPMLIVVLYTPSYSGSIPLFMLWSTSVLMATLMTDAVLRVYAQTRYLIALNLLRLVIIAGGISWFMSMFGLAGAVLITLAATLASKILALLRIRVLLGVTLAEVLPWGPLARLLTITGISMLAGDGVERTVPLAGLSLLAVTGTAYTGVCVALSFLFGPLTVAERRTLTAWSRTPLTRVRRALGA